MNQGLRMTNFVKITPIGAEKAVLINIEHIIAIEEMGESLLRIRTDEHAYEAHASMEALEQVLSRTAIVSRLC